MRREIIAGSLVLRKLEAAVAPLLLEAVQAACPPAFTQFAPWCPPAYSLADGAQFLAQSEADWQAGAAFQFALFQAPTGVLCGGSGLKQPTRVQGLYNLYNLGYWVRPAHQRPGMAGLAPRQVARAAFADLPTVQRLALLPMPANRASQRTALTAGVPYEGGAAAALTGGRRLARCPAVFAGADCCSASQSVSLPVGPPL